MTRLIIAGLITATALGCSHNHAAPAAAPTSKPTASVPRASRAPSGPVWNSMAMAEDALNRTNNERRAKGLTGLGKSANLMRAAQIQADQMARAGELEHDLPNAQYPSLSARLAAVAYPVAAAGENIGEGYHTAAEAVAGWMASSGHRANILSPKYTEMGTGVALAKDGTQYWAQVFGKPRSVARAR